MTTGTAASPNDRTAKWVNIEQVKDGTGAGLTQAYTGKGVILGIVDIGFDLTHPTFYAADGKTYRIKRFVENGKTDDTNGHAITLGREYRTEEEILGVQHSADFSTSQHGTHVLGILVPACWADVIAVGNLIGRLGAQDTTAAIPADTQGLLGTLDGTSSVGPTFTGIPVTFYNLSGTLVRQSQVENGTVSLSGMPKGVYAVQLGKLGSTLIRK